MTHRPTHDQLLARELEDPEFRAEWERLAIARALAAKLIVYRSDHNLSQRALAERLGLKQPQVARLESGEVQPSTETLMRLSSELELEFTINIAPVGRDPRQVTKRVRDGADAEIASGASVARFAVA